MRTGLVNMEKRNLEPLMILAVTGSFLFVLVTGFPGLFEGQHPVTAVTASPSLVPVEKPAVTAENDDTLQSLARDRDTIANIFAGLEPFFQAISHIQADHAVLHIAYFGDSMIEGDLVTQPLRRNMQRRFGGSGIGFIPLTSPQPCFRTTIRQTFNDDWTVYSFVHPGKTQAVTPGISGYVYISGAGAETKYESVPGYGKFRKADILYGGQNEVTVKVATDTITRVLSLIPDQGKAVSDLSVTIDSVFSVFELRVTSSKPGLLYGVNFENGPGVYVDNYAFRGNSGLPLKNIPPDVIAGFNKKLSNKLLIIHYGLNVYTPGIEDYHWYEAAMVNVIRHVKESSPGCAILMISMPDRSALISGEYYTPSGLPEFIRLQQRIANSEHVAFFNLYAAMGGANSMKQWVEGSPKLAGDDYTHPNGAGASRIASLVYDFLMKGYDRFQHCTDSIAYTSQPKPLL